MAVNLNDLREAIQRRRETGAYPSDGDLFEAVVQFEQAMRGDHDDEAARPEAKDPPIAKTRPTRGRTFKVPGDGAPKRGDT